MVKLLANDFFITTNDSVSDQHNKGIKYSANSDKSELLGEPSLGMSLFVNKYICTGNNNFLLILSNVYIEDKQCYIQE